MYFINPFKGLRPTEENAYSVTIASIDHLSKEIVAEYRNFSIYCSEMAKNKPDEEFRQIQSLKKEIEKREQVIGEFTIANRILKKKVEGSL